MRQSTKLFDTMLKIVTYRNKEEEQQKRTPFCLGFQSYEQSLKKQ
jgi:hypothetical protein